ncbi:hypothetical protein vseg_006578 [Gypsophila vaccaria]
MWPFGHELFREKFMTVSEMPGNGAQSKLVADRVLWVTQAPSRLVILMITKAPHRVLSGAWTTSCVSFSDESLFGIGRLVIKGVTSGIIRLVSGYRANCSIMSRHSLIFKLIPVLVAKLSFNGGGSCR